MYAVTVRNRDKGVASTKHVISITMDTTMWIEEPELELEWCLFFRQCWELGEQWLGCGLGVWSWSWLLIGGYGGGRSLVSSGK